MLIPLVKSRAASLGFVDMPAARKSHAVPTPLGGGIPVFMGIILTVLLAVAIADFHIPRTIVGIFAGGVLLMTVGFLDDLFELDYLTKLLGQIVSALIFLAFLEQTLPFFSAPVFITISVFWIVSLSNALNFLDNMDGLCGGITLISSAAFGVLFLFKGMSMYAVVCFAMVGGALGFLRYNLTPASIFLGDAGSLFFGYSLACLAVVHVSTVASMNLAGALGPVIILAYPVFDLTFVTFSRLKEGRKLYIGGKDHSSHRLNILVLAKRSTVFIILLLNLFLVSLGILIYRFENSPVLTLAIVMLALILSFFGAHLYKNFLFLKEKMTLVLADMFSINLAFVAYFFVRSTARDYGADFMPAGELLVALAWINAFWIVLYAVTGLYDIYFERSFGRHLILLVKTVVLGFLIFVAANYKPGQEIQVSVELIALYLGILVLLNGFTRWILNLIFKRRNFGGRRGLQAIFVCPEGTIPADKTVKPFERLYDIVGYAGDCDYKGYERLGNTHDLTDILRKNKIARVIIDYNEGNYTDIGRIFSSAYYMETLFLSAGETGDNKSGFRITPTFSEGIYAISIKHRGLFATVIKRFADFALAGAILLLTFPYSIYRILIARADKKPAIADAQIVTMGEKEGHLKIDPRRVSSSEKRGWWALISIFKGDICFYGTTITTMVEYKSNLNKIPGYWRKFLVKPGLFGPGYFGSTPLERFKLDLRYMEKTSTWGDFFMIFKQIIGISPVKIEDIKNA
jgi:UDP-GlcNAc:undecaprenyl-phosphate GlcNAc-1-phosphate transferase